MRVMERWSRWTAEADPYEADEHLKARWVSVFHDLEAGMQLPTSINVMEVWRREAEADLLADRLNKLRLEVKQLA